MRPTGEEGIEIRTCMRQATPIAVDFPASKINVAPMTDEKATT
jgi:hypothetical protein